ncbi:BACON domain-containing protein [Alistipes putredinis]|uniref:BACON domain-containing protein n=1 Tax=Alistipes putredinis TaxID=28117 RepID=UPI0024B25E24|nr:BACON domain-containing carbohydrate-binding protein [Alistipes putredinis]
MKKLSILLLSFFTVFALGLTGCSDDPDVAPATPVIKASNPADIAAGGGKVKLNFEVENPVDGQSITATSDASWLHDFTSTATQIVCEADANTGEARTAKVTLSYPEAKDVVLEVRQMSASESISISPKTLSFSYKGGTETVTVTSAKAWTLEGSADWITVDKTEGEGGQETVTFTVSTINETEEAKTVTFNFVSGGEKAPLEITQNQEGKLIIDEESKTLSVSNTEQNVTVKLQTNIEPVTATIEEGVDWIEAVDTRAMIDKEFSFKVLANTEGGPRDATIIFKNADASEQIVIKQAGKELTYPAVIPDKVLKTYIMTNFDTNKDGEISKEEAEAVKAIELTGSEIASIDGLEYFPNLETVDFTTHRLLKADFSQCYALKELNLSSGAGLSSVVLPASLEELSVMSCNKLKKIDLSAAPNLKVLYASYTGFVVAPDLSKNTKLEDIGFFGVKFSTIDVSKNTELKSLNVGGDVFNSLDVTNNPNLTDLSVTGTITELDLTKSAQLEVLNINNTKISEIDVTNCPYLRSINFDSTPIVEIDLSRNLLLTSASAYMANSLKTVWLSHDQKIETTTGIADFIKYKDYEAGPDAIANIEDEAYKTYLLTFDKNGDGKLDKTEVEAITEINIKGLGIKSLKGVEYVNFTNVRKLDCSDNELTELPIAGFFTNLEEIDFSNNKLAGQIELNKCKKLRILKGNNNMLDEVSFENTVLEAVDLSNNQLTRFQCAGNTNTLKSVNVANNLLSESSGFSCSDNAVLTDWNVSNNNLKYVYLQTMPMLENYDVSGNPLVEIATFGSGYGMALKTLNASNTPLTSLDISGNTSLQSLNIKGCATLTKVFAGILDVSKMTIEKESYTTIETTTLADAIKDKALRDYLVATYGSNGGITMEEAAKVTDLDINASNASGTKSLAGIEYFRNLKTLKVSGLESLDDTNLAIGNFNLTSIDISLEKGLTAINCYGLKNLTTFSLVVTGVAGTEVGPTHVELDKCPKIESVTVKDCRKIKVVSVAGCTELTSLNLSGSYLKSWAGDEGGTVTPSLSITSNTKLLDPAKFIPADNLAEIWATPEQVEIFAEYFKTNYKWNGKWQTVNN